MAKFTTAAGIEDLTGKLSKEDRIVMRQKKYRLPNGKIIKCGLKEAFARDKLFDITKFFNKNNIFICIYEIFFVTLRDF